MEGPHGSDGPEPPETIAWLWGFAWGGGLTASLIGILWLVYRF